MIKDYAQISSKGLVRDINQDAIFAEVENNVGLFVVADGMGGHSSGERASLAVCNGLKEWWMSIDKKAIKSSADIIQDLTSEIKKISKNIFDEFSENKQQGGTTVCALLILASSYTVISVGDSRAYCYEKNLKQITQDDVWENLPEVRNKYSEAEKIADNRSGKLTQAAGFDEEISPRISRGILKKGMTFLVCSDGVYKYCNEQDIKKILKPGLFGNKAANMVEEIKKCVEGHGAGDNFSAIVCRIQ